MVTMATAAQRVKIEQSRNNTIYITYTGKVTDDLDEKIVKLCSAQNGEH